MQADAAGFDEERRPPRHRSGAAATGAPAKSRARRTRVAMSSDQRWREILDAAAIVFQQKGYEAASIADLAEAVGMLKGSLYYYIETKEDLLFAIIQEVHEVFLRNLAVIGAMDADAVVRVRAFIEGHVAENAREAVRSAVFYRDFYSLSPERRAVIIAERDGYDRFLRQLILDGQAEGAFCVDLDAKISAIAMLGMMNHVFQWYQPDGGLSPEEVGRNFADLLLGGLICRRDEHAHEATTGKPKAKTRVPAASTRGRKGRP